jgi:hypothetical protein
MRVFISWSGELSKSLAEILREWLPGVIQAVKPYYSPDDITKGTRWTNEISKELEASRVGLICLTRDNLEAPWIMFEAGALSKNLDRSKVCPLLFDLQPTDIEGPLVQFQACQFRKDEFKKVVKMINSELGDGALPESVFESVYEMWWAKLDDRVRRLLAEHAKTKKTTLRTERDLLEEILSLSRASARPPLAGSFHPKAAQDLVSGFQLVVRECIASGLSDVLVAALRDLRKPIEYAVGKNHSHENRDRLIEELDSSLNDLNAAYGFPKPETPGPASS